MWYSRLNLAARWVVAAMVCLVCGPNSLAWAQKKPAPVKINGTIQGKAGPLLLVESSTGDKFQVGVQPKEVFDIVYSGTAEASWLRSGIPVRFTGSFNRKGQGQEPIGQLTVYNGGNFGAQAAAAGEGGGLFDEPAAAEKKRPMPVDPNAVETLQVQGVIKSVKDGKYLVSAGKSALTLELAPEAKITIEVNSLDLVQTGDSIEIDGFANPENLQQVLAEKVTVTGKTPLVGKTKPVPKTADKDKPAEKPDDAKTPEKDKPADPKAPAEKPDDTKKAGDAKPGNDGVNPLFKQ